MNIHDRRPILKRRTFWLVLIAVMVPCGWLVLVWEAGRTAMRAQRIRASALPTDVAEWLRMRDLERERLRARPAPPPAATSTR
jgi:hypothetical protein